MKTYRLLYSLQPLVLKHAKLISTSLLAANATSSVVNGVIRPEKEQENDSINKNQNLYEKKDITEKEIEERKMDSSKKDLEGIGLENVLSDLKIYGRYHLKFMLLIGILAFASMWHSVNYIFAVENVSIRCKYPNCDNTDISKLDFNSSFDVKCHKYKVYDENGACTENNFDVTNVTECNEWVYEKPDSFVAEFNLGCEGWKRTLIGTMHSVGYILGLIVMGPMSDKFGRKAVVIFTTVSCAIVGLVKSMVYSYWLYVVLETIEPIVGDCYSATFTLAIETVTKQYRPLIIFVLSIGTALGGISMAVIAWLVPNWRKFLITIYGPGLLFILFIFWLDESVRWLLNKGEKDKVVSIIKQAADTNKIKIDEDKFLRLKSEENSSNIGLKNLIKMTFCSKKLFLRLLCCICMWFTTLFNSYSLLINAVSLKGNKYLNYGLTVGGNIPASVIILYLLMKCKRKKPLIFSFILTGAFCMAHAVIPEDYAWLAVLLYALGKMCSTICIRIVYIYTSELFPTYTRNTMHALCSATGRVSAVIAPQTPLLMDYWAGLPSLIMGVLSLLTACVVTLLPDTSDDVLPENVGQAEAVGKKEKDLEKCPRVKKIEKQGHVCSRL